MLKSRKCKVDEMYERILTLRLKSHVEWLLCHQYISIRVWLAGLFNRNVCSSIIVCISPRLWLLHTLIILWVQHPLRSLLQWSFCWMHFLELSKNQFQSKWFARSQDCVECVFPKDTLGSKITMGFCGVEFLHCVASGSIFLDRCCFDSLVRSRLNSGRLGLRVKTLGVCIGLINFG